MAAMNSERESLLSPLVSAVLSFEQTRLVSIAKTKASRVECKNDKMSKKSEETVRNEPGKYQPFNVKAKTQKNAKT
jgi:hypothetical protein